MKENGFVRFLTGLLAFILSILLIVSCVVTVCVAGVTSMLKPDNIIKLVQSIDYTQLISDITSGVNVGDIVDDSVSDMVGSVDMGDIDVNLGEGFEEIPENVEIPDEIPLPEGVDGEMINALLQSEAAKEIIEQYTQGMTAVLSGETVTEEFTVDNVKEIVDENMDEIVGIAQEYVGEELSEEAIREKINEVVDSMAGEVLASLPSFEDMKQQMEGGLAAALKIVSSPVLTYVCVGICVLIALLIYACKARRCRGLMWLAVDGFVAGALVSLVRTGFDMAQPMLVETVEGMLGAASKSIIESVLSVVVDPINSGRNILFGIASACAIAFIIIRIVGAKISKKKQLEEEGFVAEPVLEEAVAQAEEALGAETVTESDIVNSIDSNV
ncbi:MAG: hypothetical protein IKK26_03175 [Clostridia bacterium]|nr:hypothetical protein [Clostridia bacterium]